MPLVVLDVALIPADLLSLREGGIYYLACSQLIVIPVSPELRLDVLFLYCHSSFSMHLAILPLPFELGGRGN